jgi:hypothetical protein
MLSESPENEIYAINQAVGNENGLICHLLSSWCMEILFNWFHIKLR